MTDFTEDAPRRRLWLLHPATISLGLLFAIVVTCAISNVRDKVQRKALAQALEPLNGEWTTLRKQALARLEALAEQIGAAGLAPVDNCAAFTGPVTVIHRPMLTAFAAGEAMPRVEPAWLNSAAWLYLARAWTPGEDDVEGHRRRNAAVARAIAAPCVGVLTSELASGARPVAAHEFAGGEVAGRLQVFCADEPRVVCQVTVGSTPLVAASVVQGNPRAQSGAEATAIGDAATRAYLQAIELALAERAPGLRVDYSR